MNSVEITSKAMEILHVFGAKMLFLLGLAIVVEIFIQVIFPTQKNKWAKVICSIAAPLVLAGILFYNELSLIEDTFSLLENVINSQLG